MKLTDRLLAVVGAVESPSGATSELTHHPKVVEWVTTRLSLLNLRFSTLLDTEIAGFIRTHADLFQENPERINEEDLHALIGKNKPLPDTMVLVKIRSPLLGGDRHIVSICFRDVKSGDVIAWYEYPLPQRMKSPPFLGAQEGQR